MHLDDSFGQSKKIKLIFNHNEQASAMCAEGYARARQQLAVVCVTTGPGGLNCLNGVFGAWTDSAPVLFISGQVKYTTTLASCPQVPLRQLGDQEVNITRIVAPLTKYAKMLTDPYDIDAVLDEAIYYATTGRPGPVWIDIPINIQAAPIDPKKLKKYRFPKNSTEKISQKQLKQAITWLQQAQRPLLVAGHGIRLSNTQKELQQLLKQTQIPVVTTFNGFDLIPSDHPQFAGRIGTVGQRAGNFALQNADIILFLGTRNNIRQVSYNWENFAKNAKKISVDIDSAELQKPTVKPDLPICTDLRTILPLFVKQLKNPLGHQNWLLHCQHLRQKYLPLREFNISPTAKVHPYYFMDQLGKLLPEKATVVASNGTACVAFFQALASKKGQRLLLNSGDASMGYGLPAAIGACAATGKNIICLEGDGSIMMNLQELQTVKTNKLPLKIFVIKNGEYISIIQTQRNFFKGRLTGCNSKSGVEVPDFIKVAKAFGLPTLRITTNKDLAKGIQHVLETDGPVLCELVCTPDYTFAPKLSARKLSDGTMISPTLEDMYPFLDRAEFEKAAYKTVK